MTRSIRIPFNRASFVGRELDYLDEVRASGDYAGNGDMTRRAEEILTASLDGATALLTTSCTSALEMSALALNFSAGDEVIVPSYTFVSTASAFSAHGARPVFADVRADTLNIDERHVDGLISARTRAIVVTHYAGVGCEMDAILALGERHGLAIIEDNAHGLFGTYRDRPLGGMGDYGALSFHATKNFSSGQGGAVIAREASAVERLRNIRENGTNRAAFERGDVDRYTWVAQGTNALPSELIAAVICAQVEERTSIQSRRQMLWERYAEALAPWAREHGATLAHVPAWCDPTYHLFHLLLPDEATREGLREHLLARGILAVSHYVPLHSSPMGLALGGRVGQCPVADDVASRVLRLPLFVTLSDAEQAEVIEAITDFDATP